MRYYAQNLTKPDGDPQGYNFNYDTKFYNPITNQYWYQPVYARLIGYSAHAMADAPLLNTARGSLIGDILYEPEEQIFSKSTIGVYAMGRMFKNDKDFTDSVKYSLLNREDVMPLQNVQPIDATDKDKNVAMNLLGVNPVIFKNNSIHIINIENKSEVDWRPVASKSRVGCTIPRSVVRTGGNVNGLMFANEEGIWLMQDAGEPINLLKGRRLKEYLLLATREGIFGEWYGKHSEAWFYIGGNTFWVCKISPEEKKMGWKNYSFPFTPIDLTLDDDGNLFLVGVNFAYKYLNDDEMTNGNDATGAPILFSITGNFQAMGERRTQFHCIEHSMNVEYTAKDGLIPNGNIQTVNVEILDERNVVMQSKPVTWNVGSEFPQTFVWGNDKSDRQSAMKVRISGALVYLKQFKMTEFNSLIKAVAQMWKSGYSKKME
jgi:hypothetical protein